MNKNQPAQPRPLDIRVSCRVTPALKQRVQNIAQSNGIAVSDVVRLALHRGLPAAVSQKGAA